MIEKSELSSLAGLQPDSILALTSKALEFWRVPCRTLHRRLRPPPAISHPAPTPRRVSQEKNNTLFHRHRLDTFKKKSGAEKEAYQAEYSKLIQHAESLQNERDRSVGQNEELRGEITLLQDKYHEQGQQVRTLQEKLISLKRKQGVVDNESPHYIAPGSPEERQNIPPQIGLQRPYGGERGPPRSPRLSTLGGSGGGGGGGGGRGLAGPIGMRSPLHTYSRQPSPTPHRAPFEGLRSGSGGGPGYDTRGRLSAPSLGLGQFGGALSGGDGGGGGGMIGSGGLTVGSRHSTPLHRSGSSSLFGRRG